MRALAHRLAESLLGGVLAVGAIVGLLFLRPEMAAAGAAGAVTGALVVWWHCRAEIVQVEPVRARADQLHDQALELRARTEQAVETSMALAFENAELTSGEHDALPGPDPEPEPWAMDGSAGPRRYPARCFNCGDMATDLLETGEIVCGLCLRLWYSDDGCPADPDGLHHVGCGCDTAGEE